MNRHYTGISDDMIRFVEKYQLKDRRLWKLTAGQYAGAPDDADLGWRGEYWGKLMRGACMTWQYTQDQELYDILSDAVDLLLRFQEPDGRISTYSREEELSGWDMWCRKYVLLGLLHYHEICRDTQRKEYILAAACRHLDYIADRVGKDRGQKRITETSHIWGGINSSSILEPVARLYRITREKRYLDFAAYIVEEGGAKDFHIFQAAFEDRLYPYEYGVVKAYELMSCFEGLAEYADVSGNEKWRRAVINFAHKLLASEKTIVGGSGCHHELFNHSAVMQTDSEYDGLMLETCVTVTWMKFMYRAYEMTGESRFLDEMECSVYNALYGAINTEKSICGDEAVFDEPEYRHVYDACMKAYGRGWQIFDSYSSLRAGIRGRAVGGFKPMCGGSVFYGCCMAIGAAGTALVPKAAVRETETGLEIGLYLPGKADLTVPAEKGDGREQTELEILTQYPNEEKVQIRLNRCKDKEGLPFEIALRIPSFAEGSLVMVNGKKMNGVRAGVFFRIRRRWKAGDEITLSFTMKPTVIFGSGRKEKSGELQKNKGYAAVCRGPLVLARDRRLGPVGTPVHLEKNFSAEPWDVDRIPFPCQTALEVRTEGESFLMIDYASAGKTWDRESEMEAWMPL